MGRFVAFLLGGFGWLMVGMLCSAVCQEGREAAHPNSAEQLWDAARRGDVEMIRQLLATGVPVDQVTAYGSTALCFASDRGHLEAVNLLLANGADPNVKDTFYRMTPLAWAQANRHYNVIKALLEAGAIGGDNLLLQAVESKDLALAKAVLDSKCCTPTILALAKHRGLSFAKDDWTELFDEVEAGDVERPKPEVLQKYVGIYGMDGADFNFCVEWVGEQLMGTLGTGGPQPLLPMGQHQFYMSGSGARLDYEFSGEQITACLLQMSGNSYRLRPLSEVPPAPSTNEVEADKSNEAENDAELETDVEWIFVPSAADALVSQVNWPGFRGTGSRGVADGQGPPISWDAGEGNHLLWKVELPGLGNSCPVIWQDRLFLTTAACDNANRDVRIGLYGNVDSVEDDSEYEFTVICLNKHTGELVWRRTVHKGRPAVKRHSKSSHANPTVATNGKFVISFFGSEGLYCHDFDGNLIWQRDLGFLDSGWFLDPGYQWGFGSSPTIFEDRVIVQCDIQQESFVAAFDLSTGVELWRTVRDEIPSWPSPVVHRFGDMPMLITHGTRAARGYDVRDGTLLWSVSGHSEIVVPTPFVAHNMIYLASGYAPVQPIVALRPEARGDIGLSAQNGANDETRALASPLAWSTMRGGPYMPTPLVYGDFLYVCSNNGILTCYDALTGELIYKERIKVGGTASFTASLVAADGHVYAAAEDGRVAVIRAGRRYQLVSVNPCGESVLATPAISEGVFYLRTIHGLMAFAESTEQSSSPGGTSRQ